jgi:hypothetical protein
MLKHDPGFLLVTLLEAVISPGKLSKNQYSGHPDKYQYLDNFLYHVVELYSREKQNLKGVK